MFNFSTHLRYLLARPTVGLQNELSNVTGEAIFSTQNTAQTSLGELTALPETRSWW